MGVISRGAYLFCFVNLKWDNCNYRKGVMEMKKCPMMFVGSNEEKNTNKNWCLESKCAWYDGALCSIRSIAFNLSGALVSMKNESTHKRED